MVLVFGYHRLPVFLLLVCHQSAAVLVPVSPQKVFICPLFSQSPCNTFWAEFTPNRCEHIRSLMSVQPTAMQQKESHKELW